MHCYKLTIAYDGTSYSGWQIQPNADSIQQYLKNAIERILSGKKIVLIGSGRTDAGVHAKGQVAHFKVDHHFDLRRFLWSLNGILPKDIRVLQIEEVALDFHSQYNAKSKEYHYHLSLDNVMDPFHRLYCWHLSRQIDTSLLRKAAEFFVGTHDFTSFSNESHSGSVARNPIRTLYRLDVCIQEKNLRLEFEGNGFLYKMVRNIVGTLVEVANGKISLSDIQTIFEARDRRRASPAAPAHGLFLVKVNYP